MSTETAEKKSTGIFSQEALAEIQSQYDEHERRIASYHSRKLLDEEKVNLGVQGLVAFCRGSHSITEFEQACDKLESCLKNGSTVGSALAEALSVKENGK